MIVKRTFMRPVAALALAVLLTACGSGQSQNPLIGPLKEILPRVLSRTPPPAPPTAAQIRSRITPEIRAQLGNVPLKIVVLEKQNLASVLIERQRNRDVVTYFTPDGISMSYKSGVLVATRGLGFDLMGADVGDVLQSLRSGRDGATRLHRYLDGEDQIVLRSFVCDYTGSGRITETCYSDGFKIENTYQMSGGRITTSRQWIGPEQGYIRLEPS